LTTCEERVEKERIQKEQKASIQAQREARQQRVMGYYQSSRLEQLLAELRDVLGILEGTYNPDPSFIEAHNDSTRSSPCGCTSLGQLMGDRPMAYVYVCLDVGRKPINDSSAQISSILVACYEDGTIDVVGEQTKHVSYQEWRNNPQRLEAELEHAYRNPYLWGKQTSKF